MSSTLQAPSTDFDIVVVGAGPAGLSFAQAIAPTGLKLCIVEKLPEAALAAPEYDGREIALTHFSARIMRELGLWERIDAAEIAPLRDACVWNGPTRVAMRLDHADSEKDQLGYLISNHLIRKAAYDGARGLRNVELRAAIQVTGIRAESEAAELQLSDGSRLRARLVVAADSRFSETRRAVGIPATMHDFGKTMLVSRMRHEAAHHQTACEWFDYGQTMALLPLNDDCTSVVLTLPDQQTRRLMQLDDTAFGAEIERRLQQRLGRMQLVSKRFTYPLVGVYPQRFVAPRFAAIGDAAVGMHPVTAHGFNFGLRSLDTLASEIRASIERGQDIGAPQPLARYDARHRQATRALYLATQAIVQLYTNDTPPSRLARDLMLRIGSQLAPFRRILVATLTEEKESEHPLVRAISFLAAHAPWPGTSR